MVLQKKAVTIPLNALMGLLFAAILIFGVVIAIGKLTNPKGPALDYIQYFSTEINNFDEVGRTTEILAPDIDAEYLIVIFPEGKATIGKSKITNSACRDTSCICVFSPTKSKILGCEIIKYPEIQEGTIVRSNITIKSADSDYQAITAERFYLRLETPRMLELFCDTKQGLCRI